MGLAKATLPGSQPPATPPQKQPPFSSPPPPQVPPGPPAEPPKPPCPPKRPPRKRSASGLAVIPMKPQGPNTGPHFGHHKSNTRRKKKHGMAKRLAPPKQKKTDTALALSYASYLPQRQAFIPVNLDLYYKIGGTSLPPGSGNLANVVALDCLIASTPLEGLRSRDQAGFGYTDVILVDPDTRIVDSYQGATTPVSSVATVLGVPSDGGTGANDTNYYFCVFTFLGKIPGLGTRRVILADCRVNQSGGGGIGILH